jgi:hypothetical protein
MSDAQLVAGFEACVRRLVEERNRPDYIQLHVAICIPEGPGGDILQDGLFVPLLGHADYTPRVTFSTSPPDCHAVAYYTPPDRGFIPTDRVNALIRQAEAIAEELQNLCRRLPARVRQALCLPETREWWRTLYHLAWHFDRPFLTSYRERLLTDGRTARRDDETIIQMHGCGGRHDVLPGLVFGTLRHDAPTASEAGIGVLLDAIRGNSPPATGPASSGTGRVFARLREWFLRAAEHQPGPRGWETFVKLLRFSDSFTTPPATEWAGLELGGQVESFWCLARINADQEFCQVRGPATRQFSEWAAEAGGALPSGAPDGPTLFDGTLGVENGVVIGAAAPTPILAPGAVERWLRFVFSTLKRLRPEELEIRWGTAAGAHSYGMATLKRDLFAASALAIELADLVPADPVGARVSPGLCFDDPWATDDYPPPGAGRYIRFHRGDRSSSGEPDWRPGWAWAERPQDGWVECGECVSGSGRVLIANGQPPVVCDWLPPDWPAGLFPLGRTAEHLAGWRGLVLSLLSHGRDTIRPDHLEYGWLTLTRATRQLAHHLGVIPLERVVTPLPASREEARREVEPLLDGLVSARRRARTPPTDKSQDTPPIDAGSDGKPGRPPDSRKQAVVKYVRDLRVDNTPWKDIPDKVFNKFGVRYTAETLRGYLKSG